MGRVFPEDEGTVRSELEMDEHFGDSEIRAGIILLLKDLRCGGKECKQNAKWGKCTYMDQAVRSIGALLKPGSLVASFPQYPVLFYHSDWDGADQEKLEVHSGLTRFKNWWQRITFGPESLPPEFYDVNRTVGDWRTYHVNGDLARETKDNIHGFGYMLMCRFYAGLIHHAPLARKLDFYLRIDGDSRLTKVKGDPFAMMHRLGKKYANYGGRGLYKEPAGAAVALPTEFAKKFPNSGARHSSCGGDDKFSCPAVAGGSGKYPQPVCHLKCPTNLPEQPQYPVPLCTLATGPSHPKCPAFYNNFEIVDMRSFRTLDQWNFFLLAEQSHLFLCEASHSGRFSKSGHCGGGGMGDAMFRTIQVNTFLRPGDVLHLTAPNLVYKHPVPIASFCGPAGTIGGGPKVIPIF